MPRGGYRENAGRKSMEEEALKIIAARNAEELARDKVTKHLELMEDSDREGIIKVAMPIFLKDKPIGDKDNPLVIKNEIADESIDKLLNAYELNKRGKDSSNKENL